MFAGKKDGDLRMCVDYRNLNMATRKDRYPIPLPTEITDRLAGKKKMTCLDLRNGYHLVRIAEGDEWKTAFRTRYGQYEYLVMPFGLMNAPSVFQRFMNEIFHDLLDITVIVYLDDILIFADTDEQLLKATKEVLRRCQKNELYCKPEKCEFNVSKTEFLGFVVSEDGVAMDTTKLEAVIQWPAPSSVKQVQTFLGFANFYRRFINGYSKICRPINDLLKKTTEFQWGKPQQEALEELKRRFTTAPLLAWPDFKKPFTIETDSSGFARSAILSQNQEDGKLHPVAYSSKSLSSAEAGYDIHDRELLAIVKAFVEWRHYLLGSETTVITDHRNLMDYILTKIPSRRQARWAKYLSQFKYKIHYRPGKYCRADGLSRRPDHDVGRGAEKPGIMNPEAFGDDLGVDVRTAATEFLQDFTIQEMINEATRHDPILRPALDFLDCKPQDAPKEVRMQFKDFTKQDGTLIFQGKIYVPNNDEIKRELLAAKHDAPLAGHPGRTRTIELVSRDYYWPSLTKYCHHYVDSCEECQRTKPINQKPSSKLEPLPAPEAPWTDVTYDLITGLPNTPRGHNAILTVVCRFTKRAHFLPTTDKADAPEVARLFRDRVWSLHGLPARTYSDRGPQFNAKFLTSLYNLLGIEPRFSTAYHPQTDGQSERANQSIEQYLRLYTSHRQNDWDEWLALGEFAFNNTKNTSTGTTPFFADLGRNPSYTPKRLNRQNQPVPAAEDWIKAKRATEEDIQSALQQAAEDHRKYYDERVLQEPTYAVGEKVWLNRKDAFTGKEATKTTRPSQKLEHR